MRAQLIVATLLSSRVALRVLRSRIPSPSAPTRTPKGRTCFVAIGWIGKSARCRNAPLSPPLRTSPRESS